MSAATPYAGPLFLVGMPRSGTKLLRELLNRHPKISIPGSETEFLPYLAHRWANFGNISDKDAFRKFYSQITRQSYFSYQREAKRLITASAWYDACREFTPAGVFEALIRLDVAAAADSGIIWGDKSPSYIDDLLLIKRLYPAARFIHIIRDVRDYCLSINKAWGKDMLRAAQRWADNIESARAVGRQMGRDYLELRYEELVSDTESAMRQAASFLGLAYDPKTLALAQPAENLGGARGETRVVTDNFGKFKEQLDRRMLRRIEALAGETMVTCGYSLAMPAQPRVRLSRFGMLAAQCRDSFNLLRFGRRERGVVGALKFHLRYFLATRG
jgi:hypothetical protein